MMALGKSMAVLATTFPFIYCIVLAEQPSLLTLQAKLRYARRASWPVLQSAQGGGKRKRRGE